MTQSTALAKYEAEGPEVLATLQALPINTHADYGEAAAFLVEVKTALNSIEAERKAITKPQREALEAVNSFFGTVAAKYEAAEKVLKQKMSAFLVAEEAREKFLMLEAARTGAVDTLALVADAAPVAAGISARTKTEWVLMRPEDVPDQYWIIDDKAINAAVRAGVVVPGIQVLKKKTLAVTGRK